MNYSDVSRIGWGSTRDVFEVTGTNDIPRFIVDEDLNSIVIKEAKNKFGKDANKRELINWNSTTYDFLCPAIKVINNGQYLIMKKADIKRVTEKHVSTVLNKYREVYKLSIYSDIKTQNIGLYKGNPVLVDYSFIDQEVKQ